MMVMVMMRKGKLMKSEIIFIENSIYIEELFDLNIVYVNQVFFTSQNDNLFSEQVNLIT